jgi:hypothetical protein
MVIKKANNLALKEAFSFILSVNVNSYEFKEFYIPYFCCKGFGGDNVTILCSKSERMIREGLQSVYRTVLAFA